MASGPELGDADLFVTLADHPMLIALAITLIAFVESFAIVGVVVPGVALLAAAAFAAGGAGVPLATALFAAWFGAILGDGASFGLGRYYGPTLRRQPWVQKHSNWLDRGERFFARHGAMGIVFGRFVGPIRPVMPLIAGTLSMAPARFFAVNLASAVGWAPVYVMPGYLVGASLVGALVPPPDWPLVIVVAAGLLWLISRAAVWSWRAGDTEGVLGRRLRATPGPGRWLTSSMLRGGGDTRLSALLALLATTIGILVLATIIALPAMAPWRDFAASLMTMLIRLW